MKDPSNTPAGLALLDQAHAAGGEIEIPGLRIRLAHTFGFCQGVKSAVEQALAALQSPSGNSAAAEGGGERAAIAGPPAGSRLFVTGEIIHNPAINADLRSRGVIPLPPPGTPDRLAGVGPADRVIIPAFGIEIEEQRQLKRIGCRLIDTTCGWVRRIWKTAEEFSQAGRTIVIHGRAEHEETRATASRVPGPWVIVRDQEEAQELARNVREPAAAWRFGGTCSPGFDPHTHLDRIGLVNQTTMLDRETQQIARILRAALAERRGPGAPRATGDAAADSEAFRALDTFCTATQRRQDAVRTLLEQEDLQCLIVVGGFRSSNTAHLARLGSARVNTYHVEDAGCLIDAGSIRHLVPGTAAPVTTTGWFPAPPRVIGVTAGASTPDVETGRILVRLVELQHAEDEGGGDPRPAPSRRR